eukprot:TRINITY_DN3481_c0_g1_i1.p1 TRINITY_DN3481_c0_g1~~TRINITY_DN3481_c0_g1_i1.p1  ORF type:complete len:671 (+),score=170.31 TRINITY_DN3481_c0_g1_i1:244-2013(+)
MPPTAEVYEFIIFRGSDIKDLHVCDPPVRTPQDPAIINAMPHQAPQAAPHPFGYGNWPPPNYLPPGGFPYGYPGNYFPPGPFQPGQTQKPLPHPMGVGPQLLQPQPNQPQGQIPPIQVGQPPSGAATANLPATQTAANTDSGPTPQVQPQTQTAQAQPIQAQNQAAQPELSTQTGAQTLLKPQQITAPKPTPALPSATSVTTVAPATSTGATVQGKNNQPQATQVALQTPQAAKITIPAASQPAAQKSQAPVQETSEKPKGARSKANASNSVSPKANNNQHNPRNALPKGKARAPISGFNNAQIQPNQTASSAPVASTPAPVNTANNSANNHVSTNTSNKNSILAQPPRQNQPRYPPSQPNTQPPLLDFPDRGGANQYNQRRRPPRYTTGQKVLEEFDFELSNSRFKKEEFEQEIKQQETQPEQDVASTAASTTAAAAAAAAAVAPPAPSPASTLLPKKAYNKTESFFDSLSCESLEKLEEEKGEKHNNKARANRSYTEQRKLDAETFGHLGRGGRGGGGYRGGVSHRGRGGSSGGNVPTGGAPRRYQNNSSGYNNHPNSNRPQPHRMYKAVNSNTQSQAPKAPVTTSS